MTAPAGSWREPLGPTAGEVGTDRVRFRVVLYLSDS